MKSLLIDPFGGMAGDMFLAALLDLADPRFDFPCLHQLIEQMLPGECHMEVRPVLCGGLGAKRFTVLSAEGATPPRRGLTDLLDLLERAQLPEGVRRRSVLALEALAVAEARVHDCALSEVHFHEVGAVDTLVDICGAALALDCLGVEELLHLPPLTGEGEVQTAHGLLPVPPPAVAELMRGRRMRRGGGQGERLTPTAAAVLMSWAREAPEDLDFRTEAMGLGAGLREFIGGPANLVRIELGECAQRAAVEEVHCLQVNLDDTTGEEIGWCCEGLFEAGALDVWSTAVQMKKNRPGVLLSALCHAAQRRELERVVFERTATLGVRWSLHSRTICEREELVVQVLDRAVRVKRRLAPAGARQNDLLSPEYEDLAELSRQCGRSLRELEGLAQEAARELLQRRES